MTYLFRFLCALAALTCATLPASAGEVYYRWLDERGRAVHSDRPPPEGVDYEVVSTGTSLKRQVEADEGVVPLEVKPRPGNRFEVLEEPAKPKKNPEYCATARDNLNQLDTKARIRSRNDDGEMYFLSDEEKLTERQKALDAIEAYCE